MFKQATIFSYKIFTGIVGEFNPKIYLCDYNKHNID